MQCVTPMFRRYKLGEYSKGKVVPREEVALDLSQDPNTIRFCLNEMNNYTRKNGKGYMYEIIPCGHCYACRLNKSAEWATRCVLETQEHVHAYWLTLTYDEEHLPIYKYFTDGQGNYFENDGTWTGTLEPEDVNIFLNSLRKYFERKGITGIRYFYAGEYGSKPQELGGARPHYHMLLWGAPLDMKQFYDFKPNPEFHYWSWHSKEIDHFWKKGFVLITQIEWSNAAYTARYSMKKLEDLAQSPTIYAESGKLKEFVRMSRRPGIGMKYFYDNMKEIYKNDEIIMKTVKGNTGSIKPPSAWDKKFKELYPTEYFMIKQQRKAAAERSRNNQYFLSDYTDLDILQHNMDKVNSKAAMLPREL